MQKRFCIPLCWENVFLFAEKMCSFICSSMPSILQTFTCYKMLESVQVVGPFKNHNGTLCSNVARVWSFGAYPAQEPKTFAASLAHPLHILRIFYILKYRYDSYNCIMHFTRWWPGRVSAFRIELVCVSHVLISSILHTYFTKLAVFEKPQNASFIFVGKWIFMLRNLIKRRSFMVMGITSTFEWGQQFSID